MMEGQQALSHVESNGMRIDTDYLNRMMVETADLLVKMEADLKQDEVWHTWKKIYGDKASIDSNDQLGKVVFEELGVPCVFRTPTGKPATTEEALEPVKFPFVQKFINRKKLFTARNTFLSGIYNEALPNGILHGIFSLNTVTTYRSSSQYPNMQNFPNRIPRTAKLIRRSFIPRSDDYVLVEFDLKGAEVCVSACYHKDPTMVDYILRGHDYHKDLAMQCYKLEKDQVTKMVRGTAKGGFVFASFYGDYYVNICQNLWNAIDQDNLKRSDGVDLKEHLKQNGITELGGLGRNPIPGTFEDHIKKVYDDFWNVRFPVYSQWKVDWFNEYLKRGWCRSLTGFTYQGINKRNEIINYPIQGSAFHALLWSLIQIDRWLVKYKMKSMIIGETHDSILMDVHKSELQDVLEYSTKVMRHDIRKIWEWITVPLDIEAVICHRNLYEKEDIKLPALVAV